MTGGNFVAWRVVALVGLLTAIAACSRDPEARRKLVDHPERGDRVLVEATAAEFFEATVLDHQGGVLHVQRTADGSSLHVQISDVYRLPPAPVHPAAGQLVICRTAEGRWSACRVREVTELGRSIPVVDVDGHEFRLKPADVLLPEGVTRLNLERRFLRAKERRDLLEEVDRSGGLRRPPQWQVAPGQRILAERQGAWFDATVTDVEKDRVVVRWEADGSVTDLDLSSIVPGPPVCGNPQSGRFALCRPRGAATAWEVVRVTHLDASDAKIRDLEGRVRTVTVRDLCPLGQQ